MYAGTGIWTDSARRKKSKISPGGGRVRGCCGKGGGAFELDAGFGVAA